MLAFIDYPFTYHPKNCDRVARAIKSILTTQSKNQFDIPFSNWLTDSLIFLHQLFWIFTDHNIVWANYSVIQLNWNKCYPYYTGQQAFSMKWDRSPFSPNIWTFRCVFSKMCCCSWILNICENTLKIKDKKNVNIICPLKYY